MSLIKISFHSKMKKILDLENKIEELEDKGLEETEECVSLENEEHELRTALRAEIKEAFSLKNEVEVARMFMGIYDLVKKNPELA